MSNEIIISFHISIIMPVQFKVFRIYGLWDVGKLQVGCASDMSAACLLEVAHTA